MQEYYKILNISEDASIEEIESAYRTLKEKYSRERFYEGEVGNEAARKLTKIETAYHEIMEERNREKMVNDKVTNDYSEVERLVRLGSISSAQELLDNYSDRDAEWHYLQSVVFYKKNWMNESKKQLEIAVNMDPHNSKYSDAYVKLKQKIEYNDAQFRSGNMGGQPQEEPKQMGMDTNGCMSTCATWCCMNLMCNMCCR